ncbi:hypothetical protein D3C84_968170 [compost metagenome]
MMAHAVEDAEIRTVVISFTAQHCYSLPGAFPRLYDPILRHPAFSRIKKMRTITFGPHSQLLGAVLRSEHGSVIEQIEKAGDC